MFDYAAYAQRIREQLHMYPEIGFDLPKTLALVHQELDDMGIPYTDKFGKSSVVATINEEKSHFTIGIRADMDALPIQEANDVPYKSRHDGIMHACGHDAHTAILLTTARKLVAMKDRIHCRIKLLFTPAEEYIEPGCRQLAENGVMDDIDCCIALHVNSGVPTGIVEITPGCLGGNSTGFQVEFHGKTAHAASQHMGRDAIMMAVESITAMEIMSAKELHPSMPRVLNIGAIQGGHTNNVVCDYCKIFGTVRTHSDQVTEHMERRIRQICETTAESCGGRADFQIVKFLPYRINHDALYQRMLEAAKKVVGEGNYRPRATRSMGGEDFGYLSRKKPCFMFELGSMPRDAKTPPQGHNDRFDIDPGCLIIGVNMFTQFVLDNMDGIDLSSGE